MAKQIVHKKSEVESSHESIEPLRITGGLELEVEQLAFADRFTPRRAGAASTDEEDGVTELELADRRRDRVSGTVADEDWGVGDEPRGILFEFRFISFFKSHIYGMD